MISQKFDSKYARTVLFVMVWAVCAWYIGARIDRGWGPPDEGLLGQTAERWINGEVPHRDFDDLYTGGLTFLHGFAFEQFGIKMSSMRIVLFAAVVLWLPLVQLIARRFVSPLVAAGLMILATVWSLPAYPAPMPSWYNLFFATAGLWAILRFIDTSAYRWAFVAGVCAGISMLAKITGMYLVASLFLTVIARAYLLAVEETERRRRVGAWAGLVAAATLTAAVFGLLVSRSTLGTWIFLFAPPAMACLALGVVAFRSGSARWVDLWRPILTITLGVIVGVAPLVAYFAAQGAIPDLIRGVFVLPRERVAFASRAPDVVPFLWALILVGVAIIAARVREPRTTKLLALLVAICGAWVYANGFRREGPGGIGGGGVVYGQMVGSLASLMPFVVGAFAWLVGTGRAATMHPAQLMRTFAVVAVAALSALLAFPYSNDLYFHYVAPLLALTVVAVIHASGKRIAQPVALVLAAVYLAFAVKHVSVRTKAPMTIDRGGLRVFAKDSGEVEAFVNLMRERAHGEYTYATGDSPEAYFLTGLRNPTRSMYAFFSPEANLPDTILAALDTHNINVIAISDWRIFSPRPTRPFLRALEARYPHSQRVWHYTVRWREPAVSTWRR